jgi:hypothetical protein
MEQVSRMWNLRLKIGSWSEGLDELLRIRNRQLLTAAYLKLPPHRAYLFVKCVRVHLSDEANQESRYSEQGKLLPTEKPEDTIARVKYPLSKVINMCIKGCSFPYYQDGKGSATHVQSCYYR